VRQKKGYVTNLQEVSAPTFAKPKQK